MDDPNQNLPQEHQESIRRELGAASTSRVGDLTSGADQNVQRARQGPSVGQCNHPREQTTLQPLQLQGQLQRAGVQPNMLTTVGGGHQPQYGGIRNNTNPALPQQKYQPQHGVHHDKSGFPLQQSPAQKQFRDSHQQGHQGQSSGTGHQSPLGTSEPGPIIAGPVRSQPTDWGELGSSARVKHRTMSGIELYHKAKEKHWLCNIFQSH